MRCSSELSCTCKCYYVLKCVADNNGCTEADIFMSTVNSGYSKESIKKGILTCMDSGWITCNSKRSVSPEKWKYNVTKLGLDVLGPVRVTEDIYEFIRLAQSISAQSIEDLDVQLALAGSHKYLEADFLKKIHSVFNNTNKHDAFRCVTNDIVKYLGLPIVFEIYARAKAVVEGDRQNKENTVA